MLLCSGSQRQAAYDVKRIRVSTVQDVIEVWTVMDSSTRIVSLMPASYDWLTKFFQKSSGDEVDY